MEVKTNPNFEVGTYGLYPWFVERGESLIFAKDLEVAKNIGMYGKIFYLKYYDGEFLHLEYRDQILRVKPDLFKAVETPKYKTGEQVLTSKGMSTVIDVNYHLKKNQEFYLLKIGGKIQKKRYFADELNIQRSI